MLPAGATVLPPVTTRPRRPDGALVVAVQLRTIAVAAVAAAASTVVVEAVAAASTVVAAAVAADRTAAAVDITNL